MFNYSPPPRTLRGKIFDLNMDCLKVIKMHFLEEADPAKEEWHKWVKFSRVHGRAARDDIIPCPHGKREKCQFTEKCHKETRQKWVWRFKVVVYIDLYIYIFFNIGRTSLSETTQKWLLQHFFRYGNVQYLDDLINFLQFDQLQVCCCMLKTLIIHFYVRCCILIGRCVEINKEWYGH